MNYMFSKIFNEVVNLDNIVLMAYSISYASQLQMPLKYGVFHMKDGLLEDLLSSGF